MVSACVIMHLLPSWLASIRHLPGKKDISTFQFLRRLWWRSIEDIIIWKLYIYLKIIDGFWLLRSAICDNKVISYRKVTVFTIVCLCVLSEQVWFFWFLQRKIRKKGKKTCSYAEGLCTAGVDFSKYRLFFIWMNLVNFAMPSNAYDSDTYYAIEFRCNT